jgi:hypothetical protein
MVEVYTDSKFPSEVVVKGVDGRLHTVGVEYP